MDWFLSLSTAWKILLGYLAVISVLSILVCVYDKFASKTGKVQWRIPEKSLFVWSVLGGGAAMFLTMLLIRHKTKHPQFMIGIPVIILLQAALLFVLVHFEVLPM